MLSPRPDVVTIGEIGWGNKPREPATVQRVNPGAASRSHSWTFRPARDGDVDPLVALHRRVFGRTISREQWLWKLAPRGPAANVWVAEAHGRIVFQYAGIPVAFRHLANDCWAMIDVDTMTDPDYRRQGLLTQGGAEAYAHWREAGIAFTVGLPNEQWGSRAAALGWTPVGVLRWWVRWLDPTGTLAARVGFRPSESPTRRRPSQRRVGRYQLALVAEPDSFDELWNLVQEEGVVRDAAWFRWRYLQAVPKWSVVGVRQSGRLVGAATYRLDGNRDHPSAMIGEVVSVGFETTRLLLRWCSEQLRGLGALRAAMLIQPGRMLEEAALSTGFLPRRATFSVEAVDLGGGLPLAASFQGGDFDAV
jgi:hypothetical protein